MGNCCNRNRKRKSSFEPSFKEEVEFAFKDLSETEEIYIVNLKFLMEEYLEPLKSNNFMDSKELKTFDEVIRDLFEFHSVFQIMLDKPMSELNRMDLADVLCDLSEVFIKNEKDLTKLYSRYGAVKYKVAAQIGAEGIPALRDFCMQKLTVIEKERERYGSVNTHMISMEFLICKPSFRMALYPYILEHLEKVSEKGTKDNMALNRAIESVRRVAAAMENAEKTGGTKKKILNFLSS